MKLLLVLLKKSLQKKSVKTGHLSMNATKRIAWDYATNIWNSRKLSLKVLRISNKIFITCGSKCTEDQEKPGKWNNADTASVALLERIANILLKIVFSKPQYQGSWCPNFTYFTTFQDFQKSVLIYLFFRYFVLIILIFEKFYPVLPHEMPNFKK